ncbi:MarR family winged helix-turn-helix transcriptional regulator [Nocardioides sp. SYSU D00038]|uniref:MarR family winged helix-turn-helix transcriptional regulator n=1 Tax=Nocardioides sp. SYSU D00038 TaxID=2812554 RepID=UPI0019673EDE|nr:MarR family transcriptional regulator [Nocardioides sp. SYSU D00038]
MSSQTSVVSLEQLLCFPLYATSRAMTRQYGALLAAQGLTYPQYLVLLALWDADGPLAVGALGERLHLDSGTLTPLLKRLEAAGHVRRRRDADDERRVLVEVTSQGEELRPAVAEVQQRVFAELDVPLEEVTELRALLRSLQARLDGRPVDGPTEPSG